VSGEDPAGSAVEEGVITVGRFADRSVEIYPLTQRGRRKGSYQLAIDNRGNAPIDVEFTGSDPESACRYDFATIAETVAPGTARFVKFDVVPHERFWKGPPKTHQFQILVSEIARHAELPAPSMAAAPTGPDAPPPPPGVVTTAPIPVQVPPPEIVNGTLLQEAMLPPWLLKALLAFIALLLILWILWITLFKPTVESAAKDAVEAPLASLNDKVNALTTTTAAPAGGTPTTAASQGGTPSGATTTTAPGNPPTATTTTTGGSLATPFGNPADIQLGFGSPVLGNSVQDFPVTPNPFTLTFALTDIVLQNPNGDTGLVQIKRNGIVILQSALENFRDLDLHFVAPFMFNPGQTLSMTVTCATPGPNGGGNCAISGSFGGFQK
jgi:hypothetical protein